jgi:hypothetical protein
MLRADPDVSEGPGALLNDRIGQIGGRRMDQQLSPSIADTL